MTIILPRLIRYSASKLYLATGIVAFAISVGCSHPITLNYSPSSVKTATGSLSVAPFKYLPSEPGATNPVEANVIRNTALGTIQIDREVKDFVRDAVFSELRFVGIKTNGESKILEGTVEEFLIDDLGYSVDWTLRIKYEVRDKETNKIVYQSVKNIQRKTAKFANFFGTLNETIKLNIEMVLDDKEFIKVING